MCAALWHSSYPTTLGRLIIRCYCSLYVFIHVGERWGQRSWSLWSGLLFCLLLMPCSFFVRQFACFIDACDAIKLLLMITGLASPWFVRLGFGISAWVSLLSWSRWCWVLWILFGCLWYRHTLYWIRESNCNSSVVMRIAVWWILLCPYYVGGEGDGYLLVACCGVCTCVFGVCCMCMLCDLGHRDC